MKRRYKIGLGLLAVILVFVGVNAYFWFTREPRPIVVVEAGDGGERVSVNGLPANFYRGLGDGPRPAILLLGGSEGGLREYRNVFARQLAQEGYSVLYQSYYATSESNRSFNMVPLETFDAALDWLSSNPEVRAGPIAVIGHSKGAEGALLLATRDARVGAVVAAMPSDVIWQGFDFDSIEMSQFSSSWSESGDPVSYLPYQSLAWHEYFTVDAPRLEMFKRSRDAATEHPSAFIPIEKATAQILLICGKNDTLWPGCRMAEEIKAKVEKREGAAIELLAYDDAGHWAFGPASDLDESDTRMLASMGGDANGDFAARRDQWPRILRFLETIAGGQGTEQNSE